MNPRRPAPLEPGATAEDELLWLVAELNWMTYAAKRAWLWAYAALAMNLGAVALTVWGWLT